MIVYTKGPIKTNTSQGVYIGSFKYTDSAGKISDVDAYYDAPNKRIILNCDEHKFSGVRPKDRTPSQKEIVRAGQVLAIKAKVLARHTQIALFKSFIK